MTLFVHRPATARRSATPRRRPRLHRPSPTHQQRAANAAWLARILIDERDRRAAANTKETP